MLLFTSLFRASKDRLKPPEQWAAGRYCLHYIILFSIVKGPIYRKLYRIRKIHVQCFRQCLMSYLIAYGLVTDISIELGTA